MKRALLSILVVIMATLAIFTLCACGKEKGGDGKSENKPAVCQHEWTFLNGTYPACKEGGYSVYKCDICKIEKTFNSVECSYVYEFKLLGESCLDGFEMKKTCIYCGNSSYASFSEHLVFDDAPAYTYEMCNDEVTNVYKCPCGELSKIDFPGNCQATGWVDNGIKKVVDEETGIVHEIAHNFCTRCKFEIKTDTYEEKIGCYTYTRQSGKIVDGETVLCEYFDKEYEIEANHQFKESYSNLLGDSCENGFVYTVECANCTYLKQYERNTHDFIFLKETIDLSEYGACGGKIYIYECACGEVKSPNTYYVVDCKDAVPQKQQETLENGVNKETITYNCAECKLVITETNEHIETSGLVKIQVTVDGQEVFFYGYNYDK